MAQNCNRIAELTEAQYDEKSDAARLATSAVLEAMSNAFKAAEIINSGQAVDRAAVYLRMAVNQMDTAEAALLLNKQILDTAPDNPAARDWLGGLDWDQLYQEGVRSKQIPSNEVQWATLVEINQSTGYLGVTAGLSEQLARCRSAATSLVEVLAENGEPAAQTAPAQLVSLLTELNNLAALAQMIAYVNRIEPLDPRWSDERVSMALNRA